jgi:hypothetical protein
MQGRVVPPADYIDSITHELMADPVLLVETGMSYDRASICSWLQKGNHTCPKTNRRLKSLLVAVKRPESLSHPGAVSLV